jgi:hypothetical protein
MKTKIENIKNFIANGDMRQALKKHGGLKSEEIDWIVQQLLAKLKL